MNVANNVRSNIEAFLVKAEYFEKTQNDPCTKQSLALKPSIDASANAISAISNEVSANEAKGGGLIDLKDPAAVNKLSNWNRTIAAEIVNIQQQIEKLNLLYSNNSPCKTYVDLRDASSEKIVEGTATTARVNALIASASKVRAEQEKIAKADSKQSALTNIDESLDEDDGAEEEPFGELTISFNNSLNRSVIRVESNLPEESLIVRATKKGAKSLRFTIKTDEEGNGGIRTRTRLSGYTVALYLDSVKLDSVRVR